MGARRAVPAAKASGRYRFGEGTFPRIPGNDGEAPIPAIRGRDGTSDRAEVPYEKVVAIQFADLWEG
jgi:hypothetical protein